MVAIKGINLLPPTVTTTEALTLYKKVAIIKSKIGRLNAELAHSIVDSHLLQLLALNESVQSTRIEGTQVTFADMIDDDDKKNKRTAVAEVDNYREALSFGIELIKNGNPISTRLIQQIHTKLMSGNTRGTTSDRGEYRKIQNFIGPDKKIEHAAYIPVGANEISEYMANLEYYINGEHHRTFEGINVSSNEIILDETTDPLIKAAIMHAQFESIHPFLDGNGRVGRMMIVLSTMLDGLVEKPVFLVSEELEKERLRYYNFLNGVRGDTPNWFGWIDFFLEASNRMTDNLLIKLISITNLSHEGLKKIDIKRSNQQQAWFLTFGQPWIDAKYLSERLKVTPTTSRSILNELEKLGLLESDVSRKRNKVYVNYGLLRLLQ
ncbi:Fic family protein [Leuconostoc gelidum subsp. aenigmaticum]|uniref:Fic family protein n=1 Tax=Leuconostoc gelidum TaxID=1244 RepID=UPI001CC70669|nr:Fic family protein [Leuconostoc gelidum]MBZ6008415.1 Fic family protein [Leuconostoc gelidum subsp. aenigmaticum]